MGKEILKMEHITKIYPNGVMANRDVSFSVREGEIHALMGENGAGKSTLMKILFGDEDATEGDIIFEGNKIQPKSAADTIRLGIGMVHQHFMLVDSLRVYENVILGMEPKNGIMIDKEKAIRAVEETAKKYNLKIDPMAVVGELSVSQKQKVEILKVLLRGAKLLILDEPTVGLDPKQIIEIRDLIKELGKKHTIILSSHILSEISAVCDHVFIISHGKLVASDSTENLLERMTGAQEIELLVKAEEDTAETAIREVAQVERCEKTESKEDGAVQLLVTAKKDADVREAIYHTCVEHHMPILEMKAASKSLEDVFLELTSQEGGTK